MNVDISESTTMSALFVVLCSTLVPLLLWTTGCETQVEEEVIDVGCAFRDTGQPPSDATTDDGSGVDADSSSIDGDTAVGGVGASCSGDGDCEEGTCESFPSGDICTRSCSKEDDPCTTRDFQCFEGTCVPKRYCEDDDSDGYGNGPACKGADCDDTAPEAHPGMEEQCGNGIDDDCDGETDEGTDQIFYPDRDGDGWGTTEGSIREVACQPPDGYTDQPGDCDDSDPEIHPGQNDECNEIDDDCDGDIDEDCNI